MSFHKRIQVLYSGYINYSPPKNSKARREGGLFEFMIF